MTISIDRSRCCDINETISREWLVTNGLGGYAAGTVAGVLTRMQHGLLVAPLPNAVTPQLLLAKIDEEVNFDQRTYYLGTNEYRDGTFNPSGFVHLEAFRLENGIPIFSYRLGGIDGIVLEKRIWMAQGYNTTYIQYHVVRSNTSDKAKSRRSGVTGPLRSANSRTTLANTQGYPSGRITGSLYSDQASQSHSITLTLLPLTTYRPYDTPAYGGNEQHFQLQLHQTEGQELLEPTIDGGSWRKHLPKGIAGCTIRASNDAHPYHLLAVGHPDNQAAFIPTGVWYWNFVRRYDAGVGLPSHDDLYLPGVIRATLWPEEEAGLTIIVSAEQLEPGLYQQEQISRSYDETILRSHQLVEEPLYAPEHSPNFYEERGRAHHLHVLPLTITPDPYVGGKEYLQTLLRSADHFLARVSPQPQRMDRPRFGRETRQEPAIVLLAHYYSMENRTRDTLIALPGLMLMPELYAEAQQILQRLSRYFIGGLLPDRLPTPGYPLLDSDYQSVDTTLWYFYALDHYLRATHDYGFLEEIFQQLKESIQHFIQGTHNGIRLDNNDGLLFAHAPGKALTWMNATVNGNPVLQRAGKAVEVNALWYHALSLMQEWSEQLVHMGHYSHDTSTYRQLLARCKENFHQRFWNDKLGYLLDVVDGPGGDDITLRVNQLFALSLRHSILESPYRKYTLDTITQHLLTPYGLRTLAPEEPEYRGRISDRTHHEQQRALHQGSAWPWLLGPYVDAQLKQWEISSVSHDQQLLQEYLWRKGLQLLEPFFERFQSGLLGMCEGVVDGNAPYHSGPYLASLLSTTELLRAYGLLAERRVVHHEQILLH